MYKTGDITVTAPFQDAAQLQGWLEMQFAKYAVEAAPELLKAGFDHPSKFDDVNASNLNALLSIRPPPIIVAMCGVTCGMRSNQPSP